MSNGFSEEVQVKLDLSHLCSKHTSKMFQKGLNCKLNLPRCDEMWRGYDASSNTNGKHSSTYILGFRGQFLASEIGHRYYRQKWSKVIRTGNHSTLRWIPTKPLFNRRNHNIGKNHSLHNCSHTKRNQKALAIMPQPPKEAASILRLFCHRKINSWFFPRNHHSYF